MPLKIAILASGTGSNAQAIIDKTKAGLLDVDIRLVFSNRPGAQVLERAEKAGIPRKALDHKLFSDRLGYDLALAEILAETGCELVVLAGYMRLLSQAFLDAFNGNVINIHPALLPSFQGTHGAQDALKYGVKLSGASAHFVEERMDSGPLIIQGAVPVNAGESLENLQNRIHVMEHRIYPQAIQWIAEKRISLQGRNVILAPSPRKRIIPDGDWLVWPPLEEGF